MTTTSTVEPDSRLPFTDGTADATAPGRCDQVWHPAGQPTSATAVLVATFDADATAPVATAQVVGGGELVHATESALYVTTFGPGPGGAPGTTIHRFALDDLTWTGSGWVPGTLLNTYAMSDQAGVLRVAVSGNQGAFDSPAVGANSVIVLDTEGSLDEIGRLDGLGKPGERIEGVRFAGEVAYVVTYLQSDPLYVIDLSDPSRPRRAGEVELGGFSAYLHPVGDDLLVGIGPAGTLEGLTGGVAATLFDVADPARPRIVDAVGLGAESEAVWDPHAVTDLGDGTLAVPVLDHAVDGAPPRCLDVCPKIGYVATPSLHVRLVRASGADLVDGGSLPVDLPLDGYPSWTRTVPVPAGLLVLTGSRVSVFDAAGTATGSTSLQP